MTNSVSSGRSASQARRTRARLKAFMQIIAEQAGSMAKFGPHGSLATELVKRAHGPARLAGRLVQVVVTWIEQRLKVMGRRDAHDPAVEYVASYQSTAVLDSALGQPQLVVRRAQELGRHPRDVDGHACGSEPPRKAYLT